MCKCSLYVLYGYIFILFSFSSVDLVKFLFFSFLFSCSKFMLPISEIKMNICLFAADINDVVQTWVNLSE